MAPHGTVSTTGEIALRVRNLTVRIDTPRGQGRAVNGVSFDLFRGETLGLVGESGSGKSMTALALMGLEPNPPASIESGEVLLGDLDLVSAKPEQLRRIRGRHIAMVMQDPMTALNPVFTIGRQLLEPLRNHMGLRGKQLHIRARELLRQLRIPSPESRLKQYPHQFSGGMRQRVVGAIALACDPEVLIADEPTTALDVTVQAAYLGLLRDLQRDQNLAILFITHDFGVVSRICDRVAVMYAGRIVELAETRRLFSSPAHPYTQALMNSVPDVREHPERLDVIQGSPPSLFDRPRGCPFNPRCPRFRALGNPAICTTDDPKLLPTEDGHLAACHFAGADDIPSAVPSTPSGAQP